MKRLLSVVATGLILCSGAMAAPLATGTRTVLPSQVQQIISVDYRAMRNSSSGMALKGRVLPENLKAFEHSLRAMGINPDSDLDQLAFVSYRAGGGIRMFGVATGQFETKKILARFRAKKQKSEKYRDATLWPTGSGFVMSFLDEDTLLFGEKSHVKEALDVRDGQRLSLSSQPEMMQLISEAEQGSVWSVLDKVGTQNMLHSALGQASSLTDFEVVKKRLRGSLYTLDLQHGVDFDLSVQTSDSFTAGTLSALMKAGILYKKATGSSAEKSAMDSMSVDSDSGKLVMKFKADDSKFMALLKTELFQAIAH